MRDRRVVLGLALVVVLCGACREASPEASTPRQVARVEPIDGTDRVRVILTEDAERRIELETTAVTSDGGELVMPYSAVFYGLDGETWTYTNVEPRTFERAPITVDRVEDGLAYLSDGPPAGTPVVTVGAAELFGVESGIGG